MNKWTYIFENHSIRKGRERQRLAQRFVFTWIIERNRIEREQTTHLPRNYLELVPEYINAAGRLTAAEPQKPTTKCLLNAGIKA
jgi:hypothetical protein